MKSLRHLLLATALTPLLLSAQTESEPNDNLGQANAITLSTAMSGDMGGAPCGSGASDDWFVLNLTQDGSVTISTTISNTGGNTGIVRIYTYNSGGGNIFSDDHSSGPNGAPGSNSSTHHCLGKGIYYFLVQRLSGDCYGYAMTVTASTPVYGADLEPNNSTAEAAANPLLAENTTTSGHINFLYNAPENADYYHITTVNDGTVDITVNAASAGAANTLRVYVYNAGGGQINSFDAATGANSVPVTTTASFSCYGQSDYYFLVQSLGGCGISYQLTYALTEPVFANDAEPNNSNPAALALAHNTFTQGHLNFLHAGDNDDRYVVNTPAEGTMTVTMTAENVTGGTVRVYVYNSSGGQINSFDASVGGNNDDDTTSASFTCYGQGLYYLQVSSLGGCGISYKLKYQTTGAVYGSDVEPNNSFPQAVTNGVLAPNTFTEGHLNFSHYGDNDDRYFVQTPAEGTMTLTMIAERVPATAGTARVYVYNSGGGQINSFDASVGGVNDDDTTTFSFDCYGQGDYYLVVQSLGACGLSYKLKYQTTGAVFGSDLEPNNSLAQALSNGTLPPNTLTDGHLNFNHYGDNNDYYAIQTADDATVNVTLIAERAPGVSGTARVYLYNSGGGQINSFNASVGGGSDDDTTTVSYHCYGQSQYYILVQSLGECGISYRLGHTLTTPAFGNDSEPNNSLATATALNPDSSNASGHLNFNHAGDNNDYYRVTLVNTGTIQFDFSAAAADPSTVRLYLYNSGGSNITSQDATVGGSNVPVTSAHVFGPYTAGTYYFLVQSLGGCGISYRFNCNDVDADGTCNFFDLCPGGPEPGTACNDNNACTINDVIGVNCFCAGTFQDTDNDGTCDASDLCPGGPEPGTACNDNDPCTTDDVIGANCLCAGTFADSDGDGTCNANDLCPTGPEPGTACNDNNAATINDIIQANCLCAGTLLGNDCEGVPGGPAVPGTACNDNNACTTGDVYGTNCLCAGTFADADADGTCDANDLCPGGPEPGTACNDNNACTTGDVIGANCQCAGTFADADGDGTCDASDLCPGGPEPGAACNDNNANTENDVVGANCVCAGTPIGGCTTTATLELQTDGTSTTTWEVRTQGSGSLVLSGGYQYPGPATFTENLCLPNGCYYLRVLDNGGDGITGGGYVLRTIGGSRIIDNRYNFTTGTLSAIASNEGFCLPLGVDRLVTGSCDKLDWKPGEYVVANENPAVSAQWLVGNQTDDGYEAWFYNPNGGYSFRRFHSHAVSDGFANVGATRACHIKINNWAAANQVPFGVLLNVKMRGRVNGANLPWGPACLFKRDELRAQCPLTKLMDIPGNQYFSCNSTRNWGSGNFVHARPVNRTNANGTLVSANRYQFRFRIPAENFSVTRTSATGSANYFIQLNWAANVLQAGKTYQVDVRASFDGGTTWCTDFIAPALTDPWGDVCTLTINSNAQGGGQNMDVDPASAETSDLRMYPNPNRGDQLNMILEGIEEGVNTVNVDIYDTFGKRVSARTVAVADGYLNTVLDLNGELAAGMYVVNITAGEAQYMERLVVQP